MPVVSFTQQLEYRFNNIGLRNTLSNSRVTSIIQDDQGFLWFGTAYGLNRYDGHDFKTFLHKSNDTSSINDNYVDKLFLGPSHSIWVYTSKGWNIYDPKKDRFNSHILPFLKSMGLPHEWFKSITRDVFNNYWFVYESGGLYKFNAKTGKIRSFSSKGTVDPLFSDNVSALSFDKNGNYWITYSEGVLEARRGKDDQLFVRKQFNVSDKKNINYQIFIDSSNDIWIYAPTEKMGAWWYRPSRAVLLKMDTKSPYNLNNEIVNGITQDDKGLIWLATDHGGVNIFDKKQNALKYLTNLSEDGSGMTENAIQTIFKDRFGTIWIGLFKNGVSYYDCRKSSFQHFYHEMNQPQSLPYNDINCFAEDKLGNLWIGTNGQGLIYFDRIRNTYKTFHSNVSNHQGLTSDVITSLYVDDANLLWIGTYFGGLYTYNGQSFTQYRHNVNDLASIPEDNVWTIFEDSKKRIWLGTLTNGLAMFDRKKSRFISYRIPRSYKYSINTIIEDHNGNIWAGGSAGIDVYNREGKLINQFIAKENAPDGLSNTSVLSLHEDINNNIWIGTRDGLNIYCPSTHRMYIYQVEDGLPHNTILRIIEDKEHRFWLSTPNGISCANLKGKLGQSKPLFTNYNESDGLQGSVFNDAAALLTRKGEVVFGGSNGFNIFQPNKDRNAKKVSPILFTNLQMMNQNILVGQKYNGRVVLQESITYLKELTLTHQQDAFTIEFASLDYIDADKLSYYYQLKGFKDAWIPLEIDQRKISFTGLLPGRYTLSVRAKNENGSWVGETATLSIKILPPWWASPWALLLYALLIITALVYGRVRIIRKARWKFAQEQAEMQVKRKQELDSMKIHFFTNVSHEFKTPLALIITPIEKLLKHCKSELEQKQFSSIYRNAKRLLNMVDELLDFGKLEKGESQLQVQEGDIYSFCQDVYQSFAEIAESKNIQYAFVGTNQGLWMRYDPDKLERVLYNMLSNAFKFTSEGGSVSLEVKDVVKDQTPYLDIIIRDTGIGIAEDQKDKIFERFYQAPLPKQFMNQGSGIGLSICKEFVMLHGGSIVVASELGHGTTFTISLPIVEGKCLVNIPRQQSNSTMVLSSPSELIQIPTLQSHPDLEHKKILVVEDNEEYRVYIKEMLSEHFIVIEASNGKEGWQKTLAEHPDLIVSDLNMPEMDGIELCQKVKNDNRTSFIPFLLLTVIGSTLRHLEGLETGANDYLTKPIIAELLISKIRNLLAQQDKLKKTYKKQITVIPTKPESDGENSDMILIQQALDYVEKNMSNAALSVQDLSRELLVGRATLYRKLFELTGKTPIEFIRDIRLQRAKGLLETNTKITIAEVAYEVGFNDPKYFTKVFKEVYKYTPSNYQDNFSKKLINDN